MLTWRWILPLQGCGDHERCEEEEEEEEEGFYMEGLGRGYQVEKWLGGGGVWLTRDVALRVKHQNS
jgi:hypothetical protein